MFQSMWKDKGIYLVSGLVILQQQQRRSNIIFLGCKMQRGQTNSTFLTVLHQQVDHLGVTLLEGYCQRSEPILLTNSRTSSTQ